MVSWLYSISLGEIGEGEEIIGGWREGGREIQLAGN